MWTWCCITIHGVYQYIRLLTVFIFRRHVRQYWWNANSAASLTTCYTWRMLSSAIYGTVSFWCVLSTTQCHVLLTDWNVRPDRNVWRQQEYASVSRSMYARTYVIEQFSVALRNETCCEWVQLGVVDCLERLVSECLELSQSCVCVCVCVCDEPSDSFVELASCLSVVLIISKWLVRHILSSVTR